MADNNQRRQGQNKVASSAQRRQLTQQLIKQINGNEHELIVLSLDALVARVKEIPTLWDKYRDALEFTSNYYASGLDTLTATKLVAELGAIGTRVKIKNYAGKQHLIIKGRIGLRKTLTAARYGASNTKVIKMGLGTSAAINAVKQGGLITIVFVTAFRVIDFALKDKATLSSLIGPLATDVVKIGIATGVSIGAASMLGVTTLATFALGPLAAVIFIGVGVSWALNKADNHYGITEQLVKALEGRHGRSNINFPPSHSNNSTDLAHYSMNGGFTMGQAFGGI